MMATKKHSINNEFSIDIDSGTRTIVWKEYDKTGNRVDNSIRLVYHKASPMGLLVKLLCKMLLSQAAIDGLIAYGTEDPDSKLTAGYHEQ